MTKTKSTEVAVVNENRLALLREKGGVSESGDNVWPKALTVNRSPLSKDDKPLPMGKYTILINEKQAFLDTADVIVITRGSQFRGWSKDKKYIGCTMIEQPGKAEFKDTLGTVKLGKFVGEDLTEEQKNQIRKTKK